MWNKQRYCGQLQDHVWIANFRGWNWKTSILWEFSYFFMVLWYGRSCKVMCGAILWVGKQDDPTTLQSIYSLHWWPPLQRRRNEICWIIVTSMLANCVEMPVFGTNWVDLTFSGQWTNLLDQSPHGQELVTDVSLVWFNTFMTQVIIDNIFMWVTEHNIADCVHSKTQILLATLRTQNQPWWGSYVFLEVGHLCEQNTLTRVFSRTLICAHAPAWFKIKCLCERSYHPHSIHVCTWAFVFVLSQSHYTFDSPFLIFDHFLHNNLSSHVADQ